MTSSIVGGIGGGQAERIPPRCIIKDCLVSLEEEQGTSDTCFWMILVDDCFSGAGGSGFDEESNDCALSFVAF